jgi:hypothetical protein
VKLAAAVVLILAGAVWILQGLDVAFAPKSVMTGDRSWVVWGAVAVVVGAGLIWRERRLR